MLMEARPPSALATLLLGLALLGLAVPIAQASAPTHIDRKGATRIAPRAVDMSVGLEAVKSADTSAKTGLRKTLGMHLRWVTIPDWALDLFYDDHPSIQGMSVGAEFAIQRGDQNTLVVEVDYTGADIPLTNWRDPGEEPSQAHFIEATGLGMVSADVTYRRTKWIGSKVGLYAGGGLGVGFIVGDATETQVLPTCVDPVATCPHWEQVNPQPMTLWSVLPVLHIQTGMEVRMVGPASLRLEMGFRNAVYAGGGVNVEF
jgi:hypothetical protein